MDDKFIKLTINFKFDPWLIRQNVMFNKNIFYLLLGMLICDSIELLLLKCYKTVTNKP